MVKNLPAIWETWVQSLVWELRFYKPCHVTKKKRKRKRKLCSPTKVGQASLVAQLVNDPSAMQETSVQYSSRLICAVQFLGGEDPLEKG